MRKNIDKQTRIRARDDFPQRVKDAVAARAAWHCSFLGCDRPTVGASESSPSGVTMVGEAAHISGAAGGRGSRRYDPLMSPDDRKGIDNAIWLCRIHAKVIDSDEATYTIDRLRAMKREHESRWGTMVRAGEAPALGTALLAIGPNIVASGDLQFATADRWTLNLKHFVIGEPSEVHSFIDGFWAAAPDERYILSNERGDGRVLAGPPILTKLPDSYLLQCPLVPPSPRIPVQDLGSGWATHPETHDLYLDEKGNIARVSGVEYFPQHVQSALSMQLGENPLSPGAGIRFFEYFEEYRASSWLSRLMMLDVIREASIPYTSEILNRTYTQLRCVTRVRGFELLSETPTNHRLPIRIDLEVEGLGRWQGVLSIYIPTKEQMDKQRKLVAPHASLAPSRGP